jgi:hypothetical protein
MEFAGGDDRHYRALIFAAQILTVSVVIKEKSWRYPQIRFTVVACAAFERSIALLCRRVKGSRMPQALRLLPKVKRAVLE